MRQHWEQLAPFWHLLENTGVTPSMIQDCSPWLSEPVLVVGAGQGLLVEALQEQGHRRVEGLEACAAMVRKARERRGIELALADALNIPAKDAAYGSVIVATGVVTRGNDDIALIQEAIRVLQPGGHLVLAVFCPDQSFATIGEELGLVTDMRLSHRRVHQLWAKGRENWLETIQQWVSLESLREQHVQILEVLHGRMELLAKNLEVQGASSSETLARAFDWELGGFVPAELFELVETAGLKVTDSNHQMDTLIAVCRRPAD